MWTYALRWCRKCNQAGTKPRKNYSLWYFGIDCDWCFTYIVTSNFSKNGLSSVLILLNALNIAFNTVNHEIHHANLGFIKTALRWLKSQSVRYPLVYLQALRWVCSSFFVHHFVGTVIHPYWSTLFWWYLDLHIHTPGGGHGLSTYFCLPYTQPKWRLFTSAFISPLFLCTCLYECKIVIMPVITFY